MNDDERITNQVLGPVTGKVVQIGHADSVTYVGTPPAQSRYRQWVRQVAPEQLVGREAELAELARFCTAPDGAPAYVWWRAAPWTGKSALMASFVLSPPDGVRVVSFFVTARSLGDDTREAFVDVVQEQLAEVLGAAKDPEARNLNAVFAEAAAHCRNRGERLVLVVDGLDEDRGASSGGHSIAALLPFPENGLRVIVASRLNPDVPPDVRGDHPLRAPGIERSLAPSPAAVAAKADMERELDGLLQDQEDLLGFLVAARGGLSSDDLAQLTQRRPRDVERVLNSAASRSFTRRPAHWRPREAPAVFLLGHENLHREAVEALGGELSRYRAAIDEWAAGYRSAGWPPDTPQFLLRGYFRLVQESGDPTALVDLAGDPARHERLLDVSGGDLAAMGELDAARAALLASDEPDLVRLIMMDTYRDNFRERNKITPERLPVVWAALGQFDHAVALAQSMIDPASRTRALRELAGELVRTGEPERAEQLAEDEHDPDLRDALLAETAVTLVHCGKHAAAARIADRASADRRRRIAAVTAAVRELDFSRAGQLAGEISRKDLRDWTLSELALLAVGDLDAAAELAGAIAHEVRRRETFGELAQRLVRAGEIDRARAFAQEHGAAGVLFHLDLTAELAASDDLAVAVGERFDEADREHRFVPVLVEFLVATDRLRDIPAVLASMTNPFVRRTALLRFVQALVAAGEADRAFQWTAQYLSTRRSAFELQDDARRFVILADALLAAGDRVRARQAAERAEAMTRRPADDPRAAAAIGALSKTVVAAGDVRRAELLAPLVRSEWQGLKEIKSLASLLAGQGDPRTAEKLICGVNFWTAMREPLILLVRRLRAAGDHAGLARLADYVRGRVKETPRDRQFGWSDWHAVIVMLAAVGEPAEVVELVAASSTVVDVGVAIEDAIADLAARGEAAAALELCGYLTERRLAQVQRILVRGLAGAGHLDQAEAVIESVEDDQEQERLILAFLPELAKHDLPRALARTRLVEAEEDRARVLVEVSAAAPPDERRRILAEAVSLDHWSVIVPALDTEELAGLLDVADRFGALYRQEDPDA
ncbi:ATP-binding protein [Amycolatopsis sp. NPDC054798]